MLFWSYLMTRGGQQKLLLGLCMLERGPRDWGGGGAKEPFDARRLLSPRPLSPPFFHLWNTTQCLPCDVPWMKVLKWTLMYKEWGKGEQFKLRQFTNPQLFETSHSFPSFQIYKLPWRTHKRQKAPAWVSVSLCIPSPPVSRPLTFIRGAVR